MIYNIKYYIKNYFNIKIGILKNIKISHYFSKSSIKFILIIFLNVVPAFGVKSNPAMVDILFQCSCRIAGLRKIANIAIYCCINKKNMNIIKVTGKVYNI